MTLLITVFVAVIATVKWYTRKDPEPAGKCLPVLYAASCGGIDTTEIIPYNRITYKE